MLFKAEFITKTGRTAVVETEKLNVPASDGRRTVLSNHMAIMLPLSMGTIETSNNGQLSHYVIGEGILYFEDNQAKLLVDDVVSLDDIDINEVNSVLNGSESVEGKLLAWYRELSEAYSRYKRN